MRRNLVCRNESARHPFRKMLPPPALDMSFAIAPPLKWWKQEDTHLFLVSFFAFFVCFSLFIN